MNLQTGFFVCLILKTDLPNTFHVAVRLFR